MQETGRALLILGVIIAVAGLLLIFWPKVGNIFNLGRLPGDINIKKDNFSFHFPIVSSIIISIIITIILNLFFRK